MRKAVTIKEVEATVFGPVGAYCPRPSFSSHSATCCIAGSPLGLAAPDRRVGQAYSTIRQGSREHCYVSNPLALNRTRSAKGARFLIFVRRAHRGGCHHIDQAASRRLPKARVPSMKPVPLTRATFGRRSGYGLRRKLEAERKAKAEAEAAARRAVLADAERLITVWNERQARRMPLLFTPTIGAALAAAASSNSVATCRHVRFGAPSDAKICPLSRG